MIDTPYYVQRGEMKTAGHSVLYTWEIHLTGDGKVATVCSADLAYRIIDMLNNAEAVKQEVNRLRAARGLRR